MDKIKSILNFLNVLDSEGKLSITNLAVIIVLVKLVIAPTASITEAGALLVALANYAHKRFTNNNSIPEPSNINDEITNQIRQLDDKISTVSLAAGLKKL